MNIGVIGLGAMGAPIARNLLRRDHLVTVYARRPEAMTPLVDSGACAAAFPADLASQRAS
jgi:2-hydroxy-3-oxopropionate reductase